MSFKYDSLHTKINDPIMRRDLLVELAGGFNRCKTDLEKRTYVEKINRDKDVVRALEVFSWFHSTQQDILYGTDVAQIIRDYRKSLK